MTRDVRWLVMVMAIGWGHYNYNMSVLENFTTFQNKYHI